MHVPFHTAVQRNSPLCTAASCSLPQKQQSTSQGTVSLERALGALDGFIQDCLAPRNLAGSSFPTLHGYKTGRDDQQQRCLFTVQRS